MQQLVLIDAETLNKLQTSIDELKQLVISQKEPTPAKKTKADLTLDELDNWLPLHLAWKKMGISKYQWYTRYQKLIKHKSYGGSTWVYAPSILQFFENGNIN